MLAFRWNSHHSENTYEGDAKEQKKSKLERPLPTGSQLEKFPGSPKGSSGLEGVLLGVTVGKKPVWD